MSAWPTARLSPTAGLFNALVALAIRLLGREVQLEADLIVATAENQRLKEEAES